MRFKDTNYSHHSHNLTSWFIYSAILAIALIYSWYFFVHVNENENILMERSFRVLAQTGSNIIQKENALEKIVSNFENKWSNPNKKLRIEITEENEDAPKISSNNTLKVSLRILNKELEKDNDLLEIKEKRKIKDNEKIVAKISNYGSTEYYAVIKKNDFYSPLLRADAFDGFLVLKGDKSNYKVTYHTLTGEVFFNKIDSLINTNTGLVSGNYSEIEIGAKTYHLFLQPLRGSLEEGTIIGGFLDHDRYKSAVRQIDSKAVVFILLGFVIFLLSIPFIKLAVMSKYENLEISDVVLLLASLLIGTMVMTLLVFYLHQAVSGKEGINSKLRNLNCMIKQSFENELNNIYDALSKLDNMKIASLKRTSYSSVLVDDFPGKVSSDTKIDEMLKDTLKSVRETYPFFKTIFWMDSSGQQLFELARRKFTGNLANLSTRNYFLHAGEWMLDDKDKNFMLESIISVTSGEKLAAISKKSAITVNSLIGDDKKPDVKVAAITSSMYSVINTIVEPGFGFCVIDRKGDVLFHSNTAQNLQENFLDESTNTAELYAAIEGRTPAYFTTSYQNRNHSCYVSPVGHAPLYLITFHDNDYISSTEVSSLLITISFCVIVLLFCVLLFVLISVILYRPTTLHKKNNPFFWLARSTRIEKDGQYSKLFFYNCFGSLLFILFSVYADDYAEVLFYMASFCCASFYYVSYTLLKRGSFPAPITINFKHLLIAGILLAALVNFYSFKILDYNGFFVLGFQIILLAAALFSETNNDYFKKLFPGKLDYRVFIFSWVAIVSYLPAVIFFIQAYDYESVLDTKLKMLELANLKEKRDYSIETLYQQKMENVKVMNDIKLRQKNLGIYGNVSFLGSGTEQINLCADAGDTMVVNDFPDDLWTAWKNKTGIEDLQNDKYGEIIFGMKSRGEKLSYKKAGLIGGSSANMNIVWKEKDDENILYLDYLKSNNHVNDTSRSIILAAEIPAFGFNNINMAILLIVGHILTLYLLYVLIRYSSTKIFGDGFLPSQIKYIDESINYVLGMNKNLSINFGHSTVLEKWIRRLDNPEIFRKDLGVREIVIYAYSENYIYDIKPIVIKDVISINIKNLQLNIDDADKTISDLKALLEQLKSSKEQIIIASTVPLQEVFRTIDSRQSESTKAEAEKSTNGKTREVIKTLLDEITNQENFTNNFYYPIKPFDEDVGRNDYRSDNEILEIIKDEISDLVFLNDLPSDILEYYYNNLIKEGDLKDYTIKERLIQEIESLAENDYYQILNSCTSMGKFVLHDYAQDQLVNYNNKSVIESLYYKGLIKYDGGFKIFNESFRNYVLSEINPEKLRRQFGRKLPKGNWAKFRIPLFIVGFGLFILLGVQTNVLSNLSSILTSVGAGLALLTKFSGILSGFKSTGSAK